MKTENNEIIEDLIDLDKKCMEIMLHSYKYEFKDKTFQTKLPYWGHK